MLSIVSGAITLATSICNLLGTEQALANLNQLKNLELELNTENQKGDAADDGKIDDLHSQIAIVIQAVNTEYAQKTPASSPSAS